MTKVKYKMGEGIKSWTMTWLRHDRYMVEIPIKRILALKALLTGKVKLTWQVPATRKDKRLIVKGKIG